MQIIEKLAEKYSKIFFYTWRLVIVFLTLEKF